ncbi:MAG: PEP-CTERM sorting domain-containing protein [Phycisphaerae bacterium]
MNIESLTILKRWSLLWLVLAAACLVPSNSPAAKMALLLKQSPVDGGSVEPGTGVHRIDGNSQVTLRAVPQPGYRFVTWLGDVDEPTSQVTGAYMDSPKIIVAVFERNEFESIEEANLMFSRPGGGLIASAADISSGSSSAGGGSRPAGFHGRRNQTNDEDDDLVGPGDPLMGPGNQVPEPATIALLTLGGVLVRMRTRKREL